MNNIFLLSFVFKASSNVFLAPFFVNIYFDYENIRVRADVNNATT